MPWLPMSASAASEPEQGGPTVPPANIPTAGDLETWKWEQHRLETDVAAQLGFSVGAMKGGRRSRTLVAEFSRSKTIEAGGGQARYGVAARLVVNVLGFNADANLTLPFVAASAEFNQLEAYADLTIEGYAGTDAGKLFPPFATFDVESYVKLMDALTSMKDIIGKNEADIRPARLWHWEPAPDTDVDARLSRSVGTAWALTRIENGDSQQKASSQYRDKDDNEALAAIAETYSGLGVDGPDAEPSEQIKAHARELLDGYKVRHPLIG